VSVSFHGVRGSDRWISGSRMKRAFDVVLSLALGLLLIGPMLVVAVLVKVTSSGPALYWSDRIGRNNQNFKMPKFRSMRVDTPAVATHLLDRPDYWLSPIGSFLRKSSLDEIPQLWSILRGHMSFVGPRPALYNQYDLVALRTMQNVHLLTPGLTGWAQVNGFRGEITNPDQIKMRINKDLWYLENWSLWMDIQILFLTVYQVFKGDKQAF